MPAAIKQSGLAEPGPSMYFSTRRMRRSPFMEVRFISPDSTAGRITCAAWPIWLWKQSILGNIAGSIVAFGFAIAMIMRERTALDLAVNACIEAGTTCWPDPSAFTRFAIYAFIGLAQVIAIFTISVSVESRERRKRYAPEWR